MKKNDGYKLWKKSLKIIPGGNGLLSKRPERYANEKWPTYFEKAKGITLVDLSGNSWKDFSHMGVGSAILGYNNKEVNQYVNKFINKGINTTLNCPEEYKLAKILISNNPFAKYVRFSRSGGEAMSIAVRIARAQSKKSELAFSGYHGWHDWYIASNLTNKKALNRHLLPGLKTKGVPSELKNTAFPFKYNSVSDLKKVLKSNPKIKIIIIEGARKNIINEEMASYLTKLQKEKSFIIIIDEITSGLRTSNAGAYKISKITPNIVVYGKALGNGFAINAIVGDDVMDQSQDTFISSSFHTERVGFVAAIKTLEIIKREKLWKHLNLMGKKLIKSLNNLANANDLCILTNDFRPLPSFELQYGKRNNEYLTYFIQELLKERILGGNSIYLSMSHSDKEIDRYLKIVEKIFINLSKIVRSKTDHSNFLEIPIIDIGFKRLT